MIIIATIIATIIAAMIAAIIAAIIAIMAEWSDNNNHGHGGAK